jgi:hypothetical protein
MESPELAKENHFSLACQATFSFFCPLWSAPGSAGAGPDKVPCAIEGNIIPLYPSVIFPGTI